jgi:peroxiredoxin (alkyl hydroperoxide reductase subunit C)
MFIKKTAPDFSADALLPNGTFKKISISEFKDKKYVLLFFYPFNFTFVCPSEILSFSNKVEEFKKRNVSVLGVSVDSKHSHRAWTNAPIGKGGLGKVNFPLVSDITKSISKKYDVLVDDAFAVRATILIDKSGTIRHYSLNDLPLGRNVDEFLRIVDALQHHEKYGEVCPAGWQKGKPAMKETLDSMNSYLKDNVNNL